MLGTNKSLPPSLASKETKNSNISSLKYHSHYGWQKTVPSKGTKYISMTTYDFNISFLHVLGLLFSISVNSLGHFPLQNFFVFDWQTLLHTWSTELFLYVFSKFLFLTS